MTGWISVKDRLPEHEQIVLACIKGKIPRVLLFHSDLDVGYLFLEIDNMRHQYFGITHWMPLPEPPQ